MIGPDGEGTSRPGNVGPPSDITQTSRVVEFNDLEGMEQQLAHRDVAAVLMEPALTNIGIVLPENGYLEGVRELTREYGTLLINDETHTFSAGPGGCTKAWSLAPDMVTIGKAIAGGIPARAYGLSVELAQRITGRADLDLIDVGGVGGTLAGNALSVAAMGATLEGVQRIIDRHELPWSISRLGARSEYRFISPAPRNGGESNASADLELEDFLHVYLANRDVLLTPFHNMALMCPATTQSDVDRHHAAFDSGITELVG